MGHNKEKTVAPPAVGATTLLTVFAVLCLTVFALLSLSTVQADGRLSDASYRAVEDYYAADSRAQEVLARIRNGEDAPDGVELTVTMEDYADHSQAVYQYAVPISDTQELQVEVRVDGRLDYEILRWQAAPVGDWELDEELDLWDGALF